MLTSPLHLPFRCRPRRSPTLQLPLGKSAAPGATVPPLPRCPLRTRTSPPQSRSSSSTRARGPWCRLCASQKACCLLTRNGAAPPTSSPSASAREVSHPSCLEAVLSFCLPSAINPQLRFVFAIQFIVGWWVVCVLMVRFHPSAVCVSRVDQSVSGYRNQTALQGVETVDDCCFACEAAAEVGGWVGGRG